MSRPVSSHPTELELEILKILWRDGPLVVQEVRDRLKRELAYSSVITIMNIMTEKRYLTRAKDGKGYRYTARLQAEATRNRMLSDLVDRAFDGSAAAVMLNLIEARGIEANELAKLRAIIDQKMKEEK